MGYVTSEQIDLYNILFTMGLHESIFIISDIYDNRVCIDYNEKFWYVDYS